MTDQDLLLAREKPEFGSGVIGVCDVCGRRQAVIVLQKERYKLCVIDFLNKTWADSGRKPGAALPPYRSERVWYPTRHGPKGEAPAIALSPTKTTRHPIVLVTPDIYGLTTTVLDAGIRLAREGFEVLLPDLAKTPGVGPREHLALRMGARTRGGVPADGARTDALVSLFRDALQYLRRRDMVDPEKSAIFGVSYGGSLASLVAAREPRLAALALAYPMPLRPADPLALLTAPTILVHGGRDPAARKFGAQLRAARPEASAATIRELPGAGHDFLARDLRAYRVAEAEEAWSALTAFLRERLLPPPPKPPTPPIARSPPPAAPTAPAAPSAPAAASAVA